jgi:hypothetical protein
MGTRTIRVDLEPGDIEFLQTTIKNAAKPPLDECGEKMRADADELAPVAQGTYAAGIKTFPTADTFVQLAKKIIATAQHSSFIEGGTGVPRRWPPRDVVQRWVQLMGIPTQFGLSLESATFVVQRHIGTTPQDGKFVMLKAFQKNEVFCTNQVMNAIASAVGGSPA